MGLDAGSLAGAAATIGGGILGQNAAAGDRGEARNQEIIANNIIQELKNAPDISKPLILEKYKQAGVLTPEMENQINAQVPSNITTDPRFKAAQMQALQQMQQRANTGLTQGDRAALNQAQLAAQSDTKSRLAAIQDKMQQQGLSDSGSALAMKLAAGQNEANQMSSNANQQAQMSQQAREQALANLGNFANQSQGQDFGQQYQQQQAQNEMQRFNINNQLGVQQRNVGAANQAQAMNLANAQNTSNMNVGNQNQELNNQLQRQMQEYGSNVNLAGMKSNSARGLGATLQNMGDKTAQGYADMGAGVGSILSSSGSGGKKGGGDSGSSSPLAFAGGDSGGMAGMATMFAADGGQVHDYRGGGQVNALNAHEKAVRPGDSLENDKIHALLSEKEIVVPRTLSESKFGKHLVKIIEAHNNLKKHINGEDQNG